MQVIKRDGRREGVRFDKITARIKRLCYNLDKQVDPATISQHVCAGVFNNVTTSALDELAAETASFKSSIHPDYGVLAARLVVSDLHKSTKKLFSDVMEDLHSYVEPTTGQPASLLADDVYDFIKSNQDALNGAIVHDRDYQYDYFGVKTLMKSYLLKLRGKIVERPGIMLMRNACGIHCGDLAATLETYNMTSLKLFTHATPTLFNAGTPKPQLSSCFLQSTTDSIEGIYQTLTDSAYISKYAGGIGLSVSNIRAQGAYIRGTNGTSNGLVPMLRVFNSSSRFIDQGGGKRKGSVAIYIEPWHADIFQVIELRQNQGAEELRARDLFLALWTNDEFMRRVEADQDWSLMSPDVCPGLIDVHGAEFDKLYRKYESEGKAKRVVKARSLWNHIGKQCIETGAPYIQFKDAANAKSNHMHLGTIRSSNLCTEIFEYSTPDEPAVCNLASISLPSCVTDGKFDYDRLANITRVITRNLNRVIDRNMYPVEGAKRSNMKHRPIGIGTQGQSDVAFMLKMAYTDPEYIAFNKSVYETIYFAATEASCDLAEKNGYYPSYPGSPTSRGIFQFDLWNKPDAIKGSRWNWPALKTRVAKFGLRNSLLVAPMPTASTSQILGNYESFEVPTSNFFTRRTLAGEFIVVNKHLLRDLIDIGLWSTDMRDRLIADHGSVQNLPIPDRLKQIYRTCNEVRIVDQIDRMLDRAIFIDQGQSFNINMRNGTQKKWSDAMFYAWKRGSKHGHYYFRSESAADPAAVTVSRRMPVIDKPLPVAIIKPVAVDGKEMLMYSASSSSSSSSSSKPATTSTEPVKTDVLKRSASWTASDDDEAAASPRNDDSPTFEPAAKTSTSAAAKTDDDDDGPCLSCSS